MSWHCSRCNSSLAVVVVLWLTERLMWRSSERLPHSRAKEPSRLCNLSGGPEEFPESPERHGHADLSMAVRQSPRKTFRGESGSIYLNTRLIQLRAQGAASLY